MEIERRFLVDASPRNLEQYPSEEILQGYVVIGADGTEVRLRREGEDYFLTVKDGGTKERNEPEAEINAEQFHVFWPMTEGKRLRKTRYYIDHDGFTAEFNVFLDHLEGLLTVEVEFISAEMCDQFVPPDWFGREVTQDKRYKSQSLAAHGLPHDFRLQEKTVCAEHQENMPEDALGIPVYELEEGVATAIAMIRKMVAAQDNPLIVGVAGGSASGKTTQVAARVKEAFGNQAIILSIDDYYRGNAFMMREAEKGNALNWDQPQAVNLPLFATHLSQLKRREVVVKPKYNFKTGEPEGNETVMPKPLVIVEGLFALDDVLRDRFDLRIFVDIGAHGRIWRRIMRDVLRTGQSPKDILDYFAAVVEPMHEQYVQSTKKNAGIVIRNEYNPAVEASRSGLHAVQIKFPGLTSPEKLRKLGAEYLGTAVQTDTCYNPSDRDLAKTGEMLRIRREGSSVVLTYKGPDSGSSFSERPKAEFLIDEESAGKLLSIYGHLVRVIEKERSLYHLDGIVLSNDIVRKVDGSQKAHIGDFTELRATDKDKDEDQLRKVIAALGFRLESGITESYFEMY